MKHSRLLVWGKPMNDRWNNTHVFALLKLGLSCAVVWISTCERLWIQLLLNPRRSELVLSCQRVLVAVKLDMTSRSVVCALRNAAIVARRDTSRQCADNVKHLRGKRVRPAAALKAAAKVVKTTIITGPATAVGILDTEDLIVLIATKSVVVVVNAVT